MINQRTIRYVLLMCLLVLGWTLPAPALAQKVAADAAVVQQAADTVTSGSAEMVESGTKSFSRTDALLASLTIFVLAIFVGFEMITKVPPTLHTPLMSGSNAISGITLVGALLSTGTGHFDVAAVIGLLAVVMATINVIGGFMVTHRMLSMFQKR